MCNFLNNKATLGVQKGMEEIYFWIEYLYNVTLSVQMYTYNYAIYIYIFIFRFPYTIYDSNVY